MAYMKYLLSRTGLFPKMEPGIEDVLKAATIAHEVKYVTRNGRGYYYVIPASKNLAHLRELMQLFSSNGVILRPHKSEHYDCLVLVVPYRGQKFMHDVAMVNRDEKNFQDVLEEYNQTKANAVTFRQKMANRFARTK